MSAMVKWRPSPFTARSVWQVIKVTGEPEGVIATRYAESLIYK